jgi:hypothetical protein
MKYLLLSLSLLWFFSINGMAKDEYADGYIISKKGDTILCKMRIPFNVGSFNELELFSSVVILDSNSKKVRLKPKDINGYGFTYKSKKYTYVSKVVDDEDRTVFVWPLELGRKISEYYYYTYNSSDLAKGSMGAIAEVYVLEDDAKQITSITRGGSLINSYKAQLRKFFESDKQLLRLIADDVKDFHDIPKFVRAANNL